MSIQIPARRAENPYRFQSVTIYSQKAVKSFKNDLYTVNRKARALWENFFHLFLSYILYNGKGPQCYAAALFVFYRVVYRKLRAYFFCLPVFVFALGAGSFMSGNAPPATAQKYRLATLQ